MVSGISQPCHFCTSRPGTWYGYRLPGMTRVYACRRHRGNLQAMCHGFIIFPVVKGKWVVA